MATLGLLTGVSYQSGIDYYKNINEQYMELVPKTRLIPPTPLLLMVSVDCSEYAEMLCERRWGDVCEYLLRGVDRLVRAGPDCLVICSNTSHMAVPLVRERHPGLPVLHIADATARAIRDKGLTRVGLLGTEPTMREDYLKVQLAKHGIETIVPDKDEDLHQIFHYIMTELGCGKFLEPTRAFFVQQAQKLAARGAEGVIMGCTEIELLLRQQDTPDIPLFASAELHIAAATRVAAGLLRVEDLMPPADKAAVLPAEPAHPAPRVFSAEDVVRLLPMRACIEAASEALRALSGRRGVMPVRQVLRIPGEKFGVLASMPCCLDEFCACKSITVFPSNAGTRLSSHQGAVLLFSTEDGRLLSVADAHAITGLRTAAASAVATRALANEGPCVLALLGTGHQAALHLAAMREVRNVSRVHVWGRNRSRAQALADSVQGVPVAVFDSAQEAVAGADVVCTLTPASEPVLQGAWLKAGAHVNAVGACTPAHRELDLEVVRRARVFVDTMEACLQEPGDLVQPLRAGELEAGHVLGELGSVLLGELPGRRAPEEVTLFKSVGCALEDLCAARAIHAAAGAA